MYDVVANPAGVCTGALTPALAVGEPSANFYGFLVLVSLTVML